MKPELLAPAGDMECLDAALRFGADAVYVGGPFMQLRAVRAGFTMDGLHEAVQKCHEKGKKLYVTVNCFAKDSELKPIADYARELQTIGVDAVIVSDLGAIAVIRRSAPDLAVHVSTQASCQNAACAQVYYDMGIRRIVLAREMTLEEIRVFRKNIPADLEIEAFVHGAMCMAYSGRCFISSYLASRSGNRGECAQPCRWRYHLVEQKRPGEFYPLEESENGTTILSSRDLRCLDFLEQLEDAGVASYKIEGRMKSPYYVATVVNAYRHAIDGTADKADLLRELDCVSHRPYCSGFYFGELQKYEPDDDMVYHQDKTFVGTVEDCKNGKVTFLMRNRVSEGEELEVISPDRVGMRFNVSHLFGASDEPIRTAVIPMERLTMNCPFELKPGDILRKN